ALGQQTSRGVGRTITSIELGVLPRVSTGWPPSVTVAPTRFVPPIVNLGSPRTRQTLVAGWVVSSGLKKPVIVGARSFVEANRATAPDVPRSTAAANATRALGPVLVLEGIVAGVYWPRSGGATRLGELGLDRS